LELEAFRTEYLSKRLLFCKASQARLDTVASVRSWDVADLLRSPRVRPFAWFQGLDGRHQVTEIDRDAALKLHSAGVTLYLKHVPEAAMLARDVARSLHVPEERIRSTVFCNQPGAVTRAHFDPVDTITLQLTGSKRWRVAANTFAPDPTMSWTTLDGSATFAELWLYAHDDLPGALPADAVEHVLEPGALLNVPRGFWHETVSTEASISLHVHHVPLPWIDLALCSLREVLQRDPAWREAPVDLWDAKRAGTNGRALASLLRSLVGAASALPPTFAAPPRS
jgi:50S ribosomal protein L16 3-hydroxylase